jgi:hypothetical protein
MATLEEIMLGLKSQEEDDKKEGFSNALLGQVTPTITAQIPGIENITLGQAPIVSQEGIQYQTPERGRDDMNAEERISDAWNQSLLGQKMEGAFGQQVFGVGNDQYQIRNKFLGTVGGQVPYSEASPQAKSEAMKAYFLGGITERPVGQTYEQAVEQTYEQAQGLPPIQLEALERLSPQQETTTTPPFEGLNPVGIGMGYGKEFSANTLSRGITPTSTFGGDLDLAARYADSISGAMGTPMTGMRPIDPNTGEPLSQQVIDIANRIGLQLPEASVPLAPQAPMSPRDLAVAEGEARLERIRSGQGLSDAALIATGKMEAPEGYYDRPTEAPVPGKSTMTVGEQAQANFERFKASGQKMTPEQVVQAKNLAASSGRTFNEETGYSKEFNPAIQAAYLARQSPTDGQGSRLTTVGGASLSEFLGGAAMPKQGYGMQTDAQGRMINPNVDRSDFNIASAYRENLLAAKPDFNRAVSDRERRGTGEMSMASATKLTGGDRDKARAMIELQRQGRDPMTGKEVEAPFEPKEIEIGGKKYIQYTPNYIQPVEEPKAPKKSEIESIREEGVKAGLPENLIRQSIASKLGLDIYDEGVANWMAGNADTMPSVEGASESSTFDPTSLTSQDKEAYDWAMANPNAPQSAQILARLSK